MTWLTWRQLRTSAAYAYASLLLIAILLAVTGPALAHLAATAGHDFLNRAQGNSADAALYDIGWIAVLATPPLIGMFWGAPLIAAELTTGTHRLVWNQTVSRTRWLAVKLIVCGAAAMAATGLLTLAVSWWSSPIDKALDATATSAAPVGYAALAFMLGVTLGLLLRRLLPAMALTGVGYIAVQVVMNLWVRPALLTPERLVMRITNTVNVGSRNGLILSQVPEPGAWITREQLTDSAGHPVALPSWASTCFTDGPGRNSQACFARLHRLYEVVVSYQPAGRFWTFQLYELGIYLALTVALAAFCVYWIRVRVS
jgi:hypothetical protein